MKKPKWYARALYMTFALALVLGLTLTAAVAPVAAIVTCAFDASPRYAKVGETVNFWEWSYDGVDPNYWVWQFGDGTGDTGSPTTSHAYAAPGNYDVTLTAYWGYNVSTGAYEATCTLTQPDYIGVGEGLIQQEEWNILTAMDEFWVPDTYYGRVVNWRIMPRFGMPGNYDTYRAAGGNIAAGPAMNDWIRVQSASLGEILIAADIGHFDYEVDEWVIDFTIYGVKKWGKIDATELYRWDPYIGELLEGPGETQVMWYEDFVSILADGFMQDNNFGLKKGHFGYGVLVDRVIGTFFEDGQLVPTLHSGADGAVVHWWVLDARADVHYLPQTYDEGWAADDLIDEINALQADHPVRHTEFVFGTPAVVPGDMTHVTTVSESVDFDGNGKIEADNEEFGWTENILWADGEESVKVVLVATYPFIDGPQYPVFAEKTSWNFWTQELEKIPQVRWAGEKIVLEKQFGTSYQGNPVCFNLENQSPGALEPIDPYASYYPTLPQTAQSVWVTVDRMGVARAILTSESPGECDVSCALYEQMEPPPFRLINQHGFVVFFLKFEGITLGNVEGVREGHNEGLWTPPNPWDTSTDMTAETLNVSEDTLLRARVKGWFMGDNGSGRPASFVDLNHNGTWDPGETTLPADRWVLPDDWEYLAGPMWNEFRPHWDIMTQPNDDVLGVTELGPYFDAYGWFVADNPVIGPYSSLDNYTPWLNFPPGRKTIVRNAKLNWWDAPMPPAKVIFEVTDGPGFFKDADKGDIYYLWIDGYLAYTNPFYEVMIPASLSIPAFINNGGYDWDSWDDAYGPYPFWEIINQPPGMTPADPQHPTKVEVYSDNHGEAMVWLNGDWNLDLEPWKVEGKDPPYDAYDVPTGTEVGTTTAIAIADYPYLRKHHVVVSDEVTKTWTWGKEIKGYSVDLSDVEKRVFVFVCDRDGFPVIGERIVWKLTGSNGGYIESYLQDTNGQDILGLGYPAGESWMREPTPAEAAAFETQFGVPCHHAIAGVVIHNSLGSLANLSIEFYEREGAIVRDVLLDFNPGNPDIFWPDAQDPPVVLYCNEANSGWNQSWWRPQTNPTVADAVQPLGDAFVAIWHRDNETGAWTAYKAGAGFANDLDRLMCWEIYSIQVTQDITWNQGS